MQRVAQYGTIKRQAIKLTDTLQTIEERAREKKDMTLRKQEEVRNNR